MGKKKSSRIAVILIAALLISQFNVVSYGAETGSFGGDRYADEDGSVSEPVIHFTVPPKAAEPVPEAPDYHDVFSTPVFTPTQIPTPFQNVNPTPVPSAPVFKDPTQTIGPFPGNSNEPEADPESEPAAGTEPSPAPTPVVTITPIPTPSPLPADKPGPEEESADNEPEEMEGIPEGIPERIRELIREGRARVAEANTVSDDSIEPENTVSGPKEDDSVLSADEIRADKGATITGIQLEGSLITIHPKDKIQINVTLSPSGASKSDLSWTSTNTSVATVDSNGWITGGSLGETTIIVRSTNSSVSAQCKIIVAEQLPEKINLNPSSLLILYLGKPGENPKTVKATIQPTGVKQEYRKLIWEIADPSVASKSDSGGESCTVTGLKVGTTKLRVKAEANPVNCKAEITVDVRQWVDVSKVTVSPKEVTINVGETYDDLTADVQPPTASEQSVTWSSNKTSVATVNRYSGRVTGVAEGDAIITATSDSSQTPKPSDTCIVHVKKVPVDNITVNPTTLRVTETKTGTFSVTITPQNATNKGFTVKSADESIATVSTTSASIPSGSTSRTITVTGVKSRPEPVDITVTADDGGGSKTAVCHVYVDPPVPVTELNVTPAEKTVIVGNSELISGAVNADATNKNMTWTVSDPSIAKITSSTYTSCYVEGLKKGTTKVIATSDGNPAITDYCLLTVIPIALNVNLDKTSLTLEEEQEGSLSATITPAGVAYKEIRWSIDDPSVATISGNGLSCKITALPTDVPSRTATITATVVSADEDPTEYSSTCLLTVTRKPNPLQDLIISPERQTVKTGKSFPLQWELVPSDADHDSITISSNDPGIASVEKTGENEAQVNGVSVGDTQITVTAKNGDITYSKTCFVTVEWINVTSVSLSCDEIFMVEGETRKLDATVFPANAEDTSVSWNSADHSIATVDQSGLVTAVSEGTTIVTVVTNDGGHKAVCAVHVRRPGIDVEGITVTPSENTINIGDVFTVTAHVTPDDATDKTIIWKSNNPAVAVVRGEGLSVNAVGMAAGSAVISATASNGKTAFCIVNVEKGLTHVTDILIPMFETIYVGQSASIVATITPDDADDKTVIWTSEDEDIVSVNSSGRITGIKEGKGTVVARTADGGYEARCLVSVINPKPDPGIYKLYIADERKDAFHPEMVRGMVESLAGDRYLVIFDSDGAGIKPLITGDSTLEYTQALFYDMWITDIKGYPKNDFVRCTVRIPLPPAMDIHKGTVRVVSKRGDALDKTIPSSVGEEAGVAYVSFTAEHFTEYAILYKKSPEEKPETKIVYRDVPVIQYVPVKEKPKKEPAKEVKSATPQPTPTPTPTPVPAQPVIIPRILDSVPKTGDRNR